MKAKDFVKSKYPCATAFPVEIFNNEGATTASKAWTNAKKEILNKQL